MTVPAFLMKDQPRSHMERSTLPTVGKWYAGSSMTKGAGSPANILVFFNMIPETMMARDADKVGAGGIPTMRRRTGRRQ